MNLERAGDHHADMVGRKEDSYMVKHWLSSHQEGPAPPKFRFNVIARLSRQLVEAVWIDLRGKDILNSRSEYNRCMFPRLFIDQDEWKSYKKKEKADIEPTIEVPNR